VEYLSGISDHELLLLYRQASLAAFSFEWAVANNAVLEAMATGLPIVATDVGGVREYVRPDFGTLFAPGDGKNMARQILQILDGPEAAKQMASAARAHAVCLEYSRVSEQMLSVYQRVAGA
jgi:glycosyltransferase involved in cell wall biosynthesis